MPDPVADADHLSPRRRPVTRDRALATAIEVADAEGIDAVSMRSVAARLGVVPMALYKHVTSKDDLLDGMVDVVVVAFPVPPSGLSWKASVRAQVLGARGVVTEHPWARRAIETRTTRTPQVLTHMDRTAGLFLAGGLSADLTHHAMHALGHRIWGFSPEAFQDDGAPRRPDPQLPAPEADALMEQARAVYPHIVAIAESAGPGVSCDEDAEFAFSLDLLLDGVERLHQAGWRSRADGRSQAPGEHPDAEGQLPAEDRQGGDGRER